jgi:hypothetical protein
MSFAVRDNPGWPALCEVGKGGAAPLLRRPSKPAGFFGVFPAFERNPTFESKTRKNIGFITKFSPARSNTKSALLKIVPRGTFLPVNNFGN